MAQGVLELHVQIDGQDRVLKTTNDLKTAFSDLQKVADNAQVGSKEFKEANKQLLMLKDRMKDASTSAANSAGYWKAFKNGLGDAAGGVSVLGTSLGGLFKMLMTNPIGLLITAIVLVAKKLSEWENVMKPVEALVKTLGVALDRLIQPIGFVRYYFYCVPFYSTCAYVSQSRYTLCPIGESFATLICTSFSFIVFGVMVITPLLSILPSLLGIMFGFTSVPLIVIVSFSVFPII